MSDIETIRHNLLSWYDRHKRPLPWRQTSDPYRIWLSEIMLQQTLVPTVIPYYEKFLSRFPTLQSVAEASLDELLLLWQGLGYYNRIRQFHKAAKKVVDEYSGVIPSTKEELMLLPGLGPYTAGAMASIAFGQPVFAVDGNIIRVLSRLFHFTENAFTTQAKKYFEEKASSLVDPARPGDFNQALMDLGSSLCTPTRPACPLCPVNDLCEAYRKGKPESLPVRLKKTVYRKEKLICLIHSRNGKFWLRRRGKNEIMAGLWEFPLVFIQPRMEKNSPPLKIKRGSGGVMRMENVSFVLNSPPPGTHRPPLVRGRWGRSSSSAPKPLHPPLAARLGNPPLDIKRGGLPLKPITHTIMNRRMTIHPYRVEALKFAKKDDEGRWIRSDRLRQLPLTTITRKVLQQWNHSQTKRVPLSSQFS